MTVKERITEISKATGISEDVVRRVLNAECESVAATLKKGEKSTLIGRCTFIPTLCTKPEVDENTGKIVAKKVIGVRVAPSKSMLARLEDICEEDFNKNDSERYQIPNLAALQIEGLV